jgi:hypothetical protein
MSYSGEIENIRQETLEIIGGNFSHFRPGFWTERNVSFFFLYWTLTKEYTVP